LSTFWAGSVFFFDFADQDFAFAMRAFDGFTSHGIVLALLVVILGHRFEGGKRVRQTIMPAPEISCCQASFFLKPLVVRWLLAGNYTQPKGVSGWLAMLFSRVLP